MSSMTLRLSDEKHKRLKALAVARGVSVNKLLDEAATVMLAEFDAETRFTARAARGDIKRGLDLLDKALQR
ncbi:MAG: toxin-antitoxin system HicB family antitoxin [Neisseria sp.]|nr:toxin-antitoxin system HicB family antitoxin [Neisseria sp.]